jgi:LAO/AO transport system kinase
VDLAAILDRNPRAIARAATAIENRSQRADPLLRALFPHTGRALTVGITGAPGSGKSTVVQALITLLRSRGKTVGVIAVDPTSPFTGGALLGDRIRMMNHHADPGVFIRSMATRGQLGGLAAATTDLTVLLDAAGFDVILIETVGVGQDEIDIARVADVTALVLVPGLGDDVQAIKAGIMEIADVYILNKADHPGIENLDREVRNLLQLAPRDDGWTPPVVSCVASEGRGIEEALDAAESFAATGIPAKRARAHWEVRLTAMYRDRLASTLAHADVQEAAERVARRTTDPYTVVEQWLKAHGGYA